MDQNSVFLGRDPYIVNHLYITVSYMIFYGFLKKLNFRSKSIDVSLRFTKNRQFWAKTEQNSVFLGHDTHIADKLYITVSYMIFYGFSKNSNFRSKSIGNAYDFTKNRQSWTKTDQNSVFLGCDPHIVYR
jgi:hypothetical protein